jgi:acyl-CoA reductase-like NAD-dependent aldehyde dehydrogenase
MTTSSAPSASAPVSDFVASGPHGLFIDGEFVQAADGTTFDTVNPATGDVLTSCAAGGREDVDRAVAAARRALSGPWARLTPSERGRVLWQIADLLERDADQIAELETLDNGKPLSLARGDDLPMAIDHFRYFAGWATKLQGETIPVSTDTPYLNYTVREPIGVVGAIIPWNYPLMLVAWKLAPALACGNACVLKPAEQTPLSALWFCRLLQELDLPAGAVNVVTGLGETAGAALAEHEDVDQITFTGSTEVGRSIVRASEGNLKRVTLELGGKSPNVVFADADLEQTIDGAATAIFYNMGQDCAAGSRLFVEQGVYDDVVQGVADRAKALKVGNGFEAGVDQGPLVSGEQLDKVLGYLEDGQQAGAEVVTGGARVTSDALANGYFVEPTVFAQAGNAMRIAREEIFGPVVAAIPFKDADDAVLQSNDTRYGLGAGVWTRDVGKAHRVARSLQAGTVWINCYNVYDSASPFGGYKESGFGRDLGRSALDTFTQTKSIWVDLS